MEVINLNDNQVINCSEDLVRLTIGDFDGNWAKESETVETRGGEICLRGEAHEIRDDYYYESEFSDYGIVYDEYSEAYELDSNCYYGYTSRNCMGYFSHDSDYIHFNDTYYMNDDVADENGVSYCGSCEFHYDASDGCNCSDYDDYCFNYHSGYRDDYSQDSIVKIGFEVEKEDLEVKTFEYPAELFSETGWAKESDGSLDDESGFELISPVFPLNLSIEASKQGAITNSFEQVKCYLNANYSKACGGHINVSKVGFDSKQLLNYISGYIPLFYAIYQSRIENVYSPVYSLQTYTNSVARRAAFNCKHDGILEIRLIPAVKSMANLIWRTELIRLILSNPTSSYKNALQNIVNPKAELHQHLRKIFNQHEMLSKVKLFIKYAKQFENVELSSKVVNRSVVKVLKVA